MRAVSSAVPVPITCRLGRPVRFHANQASTSTGLDTMMSMPSNPDAITDLRIGSTMSMSAPSSLKRDCPGIGRAPAVMMTMSASAQSLQSPTRIFVYRLKNSSPSARSIASPCARWGVRLISTTSLHRPLATIVDTTVIPTWPVPTTTTRLRRTSMDNFPSFLSSVPHGTRFGVFGRTSIA